MTSKGKPFRDTYKTIAMNPDHVAMEDPVANILSKTHQGATGNLGIHESLNKMAEYQQWIDQHQSKWNAIKDHLISV